MNIIRTIFSRTGLGRQERGDTIVEVLIAISIISLVLVSAYVITNKNTLSSQDVQEHTYAQGLVVGQLELLHTQPAPSSGGCFIPPSSTDCSVTNGGAKYMLSITGTAPVYAVTAKWDSLLGGSGDVTMYYRIPQ